MVWAGKVELLTEDPLCNGERYSGQTHPGVEGVEVGDGRLSVRVAVEHGLQPQARQHRRTS